MKNVIPAIAGGNSHSTQRKSHEQRRRRAPKRKYQRKYQTRILPEGRGETREHRPEFMRNDIMQSLDPSAWLGFGSRSDGRVECWIQSPIPAALCRPPLCLHMTTAVVHCCLDTAQPQPQELEIVDKNEKAVLTSQGWPAPNGQLIVLKCLGELVALL